MPGLRDYQLEDCKQLASALKGHRRVVYRLPTGAGKTVVAGKLASSYLSHHPDGHVWFLAHRRELVLQAAKTMRAFGVQPGIIAAGHARRTWRRLQIASIPTLVNRIRKHQMGLDGGLRHEPELIIVDEGHHATAKTYRLIMEAYPEAMVLMLTATPQRMDGVGLQDIADYLHCSVPEDVLIEQDYLARPRLFVRETDISHVTAIKRGDFDLSEQASKAAGTIAETVTAYKAHADGRRAIFFGASVKHSKMVCERLQGAGYRAAHVDAKTLPRIREQVLAKFASGEIQIVCNRDIITEGFDCPETEAVILGRKTASLGLYMQMCGRVMRPGPDKRIIDLAGNVMHHGAPHDRREWKLNSAARKAKAMRAGNAGALSRWICAAPCFACNRITWDTCESCGKERPTRNPPRETKQLLQEIDPALARNPAGTPGYADYGGAMKAATDLLATCQAERRSLQEYELRAIGKRFNMPSGWVKQTLPLFVAATAYSRVLA